MNKKILVGKLTKINGDKNATVTVSYVKMHKRYKKAIRFTRKFSVANTVSAKVNDTVRIMESRPLSKTKHFVVYEIVK